MSDTFGFVELNSIARGVLAADSMLKAAQVDLALACPNCPGKYNILVTGEVSAVTAAVDAGVAEGAENVIEHLVIARIHPQVKLAIGRSTEPGQVNAVGVIESFSITASILAADSAVKAADVTLIDVRLGTGIGGKSFVVLTGDTSAVNEAVRCGAEAIAEGGMLMNAVVIPNPRMEIFEKLL